MPEAFSQVLATWQSFHVLIGTSAAALIGIQFVIVTLIANSRLRPPPEALSAYGTPTLAHLGAALLVSAVMAAPWSSALPVAAVLGTLGAAGVLYGLVTFRKARTQTHYRPECSDWLWYSVVPGLIYALLGLAAVGLCRFDASFFAVAASSLGLLLVGIRNAWDSITHIAIHQTTGNE